MALTLSARGSLGAPCREERTMVDGNVLIMIMVMKLKNAEKIVLMSRKSAVEE